MTVCMSCGCLLNAQCLKCLNASVPPLPEIPTNINEYWRLRFSTIQKAGGEGLPLYSLLSFEERNKIRLNLYAWLFGAFYYLYKGLWRQAATWVFGTMLIALVILLLFGEGAGATIFANLVSLCVAIPFTLRANENYYRLIVLKKKCWW